MVILLKDYGVKDIIIGEGSAPRGGKKKDQLVGTRLIFKCLRIPLLIKEVRGEIS